MNIHGVVNHVRVVEKLDLSLQNISLGIQLPLLQELQQREHKMPVQMRRYTRCQVVLRRHVVAEDFGFAAAPVDRLILERTKMLIGFRPLSF